MKVITSLVVSSALASLVVAQAASGPVLSIPTEVNRNDARAMAIRNVSQTIWNEDRYWNIKGVNYKLIQGPGAAAMNQILVKEMPTIMKYSAPNQHNLPGAVKDRVPPVNTLKDYAGVYNYVTDLYNVPMAVAIDDESFGDHRLSMKGFNMRIVSPLSNEFADIDFPFTFESQVERICGEGMHSVEDVRDAEALFVTDFSHIAQFNDPDQKRKHAPNVVGFFCYNNDTDKLKPVAIHVVDTKLTYSPYDTQEEWTLAKMALNAAEINYQQIHHMVETHMAFVPMKVEMMRTMAPEHPVHALVAHHLFTDLSVQFNAGKMLFSPNTTLDNTFAFGAVGSLRFVAHDLPRVSFADDFPAEVERRGWNKIPTHRYTAYGTQFYDLLKTFVDGYLSVYYASDVAVQRDFELQNWAKQTATNIDTYDFPESFESLESLSKLLTHVVFQHAFKHHAMNGRVSWETIALPYSAPAIWKEMPTFKTKHGKKHINLLEYVPPQSNIMDVMKVATMYYRPVPEEVTLLKAYRVAPFSQVTELQPHVNELEAGLRELDSFVVSNEATKDHPYDLLRPAALPYFAWI